MKTGIRVVLLVAVLAAFSSYAYLSSLQSQAGPSVSTAIDFPLFLNNEPIGSVADMGLLDRRLRSMQEKLPNFNAGGEALPSIGQVVFYSDDHMSMADIGKIWQQFDDFLNHTGYDSFSFWNQNECVNSPAESTPAKLPTLVLSTVKLEPKQLESMKTRRNCWIRASIIPTAPRERYDSQLLKSYRVVYTGFEITSTGEYRINERARNPSHRVSPSANLTNPRFSRRLESAIVKQRPVAVSALDREVKAWFDRRVLEGSSEIFWYEETLVALPIVINGRAPYSALAEVLRRVPRANTVMRIVIDNTDQ